MFVLWCYFYLFWRDDLLTAVEYLIKNESTPLDFILVETNGLADPSAVQNNPQRNNYPQRKLA